MVFSGHRRNAIRYAGTSNNGKMNRDEIRDILESIKIPDSTLPEDMQKLLLPLNAAIVKMAPECLYKYRSCTEDTISAFENDELWMSTSDMFNDPFDTLIQFNENEFRSACEGLSNPDILKIMTQHFANGGQIAPIVSQIVDEKELVRLRELAKAASANHKQEDDDEQLRVNLQIQLAYYMNNLPQIVQSFSTVACLSEKIDSILMWSHYSDNHKGFALGYDFKSFFPSQESGLGIFPLVYGEKRYDASEYLIWILCSLFHIPTRNPDMMNSIKLLLYKSMDWKYEHEWRLINNKPGDFPVSRANPIIVKPKSIYYGCRISEENRDRLHAIAVSKGIEEHNMMVDNAADSYRMTIRE